LLQTLTLMEQVGEKLGLPGALDAVAQLAVTTGRAQPATRLAAAADRLRAISGTRAWPVPERRRARWLATVREELGDTVYATAWEQGELMTPEQAIAHAHQQLAGHHRPLPARW